MNSDSLASVLYPSKAEPVVEATPENLSAAQVQVAVAPAEESHGALAPQQGESKDIGAALYGAKAAPDKVPELESYIWNARLEAIKSGDMERAAALGAAEAGILDDFKAAGAPVDVLADGMKEFSAHLGRTSELTPEQSEAARVGALSQLEAEWGGDFTVNVNLARRMTAHIEKVAPGFMDSLECSGAGNDPKLIKRLAAEARRRGMKG